MFDLVFLILDRIIKNIMKNINQNVYLKCNIYIANKIILEQLQECLGM